MSARIPACSCRGRQTWYKGATTLCGPFFGQAQCLSVSAITTPLPLTVNQERIDQHCQKLQLSGSAPQNSRQAWCDRSTMQGMQRLLASSCSRVRAYGGTRFNMQQLPEPEWEAFGSFYFMLPRFVFTAADHNFRSGLACRHSAELDLRSPGQRHLNLRMTPCSVFLDVEPAPST
jgi:hypothetical protein